MQPPRELREWVVSAHMNKTGVGDDDPTTAEPRNRFFETREAPIF